MAMPVVMVAVVRTRLVRSLFFSMRVLSSALRMMEDLCIGATSEIGARVSAKRIRM